MCEHLWGVREKESVKCENTINFNNLHRYVPRWHIFPQTTRNMLQIRMIYNSLLLCLCACPQPPSPAHSSSPATELSQALPLPLSTCRLTAKTLIFITPFVVLIFCFPWRRKEFPPLCFLFLPASFSSVPLSHCLCSISNFSSTLYGSAYINQNCHPSSVVWKKRCPCASGSLEQLFLPLRRIILHWDSSLLLPSIYCFCTNLHRRRMN